ncbi:hypothetical protein KI387_037788, partial [Taxus chinensis]
MLMRCNKEGWCAKEGARLVLAAYSLHYVKVWRALRAQKVFDACSKHEGCASGTDLIHAAEGD